MSKQNAYIIREVLRIVDRYYQDVSALAGKDLLLILGKSGAGKSTLINALFDVIFKINKETGELQPINPENLITAIGQLGDGGISCTDLPSFHYSEQLKMYIIDTQGFHDVRSNRINNIASSILLEMAVRQAKSVRIIYLIKYQNIKDGLTEFNEDCQYLKRVIKKDDTPLFLLFNRFIPTPILIEKEFDKWCESDKNREIKHNISKIIDNMTNGLENICKDGLKRFLYREQDISIGSQNIDDNNILNKNLIDVLSNEDSHKDASNDKEYQEIAEKAFYMSILKNCISTNSYGYIDPTSQESINIFINSLNGLKNIDINNFICNGSNDERLEFNLIFEETLLNELNFMNQVNFAYRYHDNIYDNFEKTINEKIQLNSNKISQLNENRVTEELLEEAEDQIKITRIRLIDSISNLNERKNIIQNEKTDFENADDKPYWIDEWNINPGFLLWRDHLCKYNSPINFSRVEEKLDKHTERYEVLSDTSPNYEVLYSSGGRIRRYLFFGTLGSLRIFGLKGLLGLGAIKFTTHKCAGKVTIYAYPKDIEPNVIPEYDRQINELQAAIDKAQMDLDAFDNSTVKASITTKLESCIEVSKNQSKQLKSIKSMVDKIKSKYDESNDHHSSKRNDYHLYYKIIDLLYGTKIINKISIAKFCQLYQEINEEKNDFPQIELETFINEGNVFLKPEYELVENQLSHEYLAPNEFPCIIKHYKNISYVISEPVKQSSPNCSGIYKRIILYIFLFIFLVYLMAFYS